MLGRKAAIMNHVHRVILAALLLTSPTVLAAQSQATSGVIQGVVRAADGTALPAVSITITNRENGAVRRVQTDLLGRYRSPSLSLGNYEVSAEHAGFSPLRQSGIVLQIAQTLNVNFTLRQTGGEPVTVVSGQSFVDFERKQPGATVNSRFVSNLPVRSRKFMDLGVLVPGATEFGDRDSSATADFSGVNHFYSNALVDGVDSFQAWSNLPKGKFLVPYEFSQSAIREFQILAGNFNAEFGRSAGGLVNAVTKSGTNEWHGDLSYFLSHSALNATPRFATEKPDTREHIFGASLGGPLVRDKFMIFGNYDQMIRSEPMIVTSGTVLSGFDATLASITNADERQRFLQARDFVQSLTGDFERDIDQNIGLIRADWIPNSVHTIGARLNYQDLRATNVPENGFTTPIVSGMAVSNNGRVKVRNGSLALQWTAAFSSRWVNEARMHFTDGRENEIPNGEGPQVRIGSGRTGIAFGRRETFPLRLHEKRWQWLDNITLFQGSHEIKAGVDIHHISDTSSSLMALDGAYQFNSLRDFANGRFMAYTQGFGVPESKTVSPYYSAFIQDDFRPLSNLNVNLGLRYEYQKLDQPSIVNPQFPQTGEIPQDKNNFAPRVALAWQPAQNLIARASYGIYYGPLPLQVNAIAKTQNGILQNVREFRGAAAAGIVYPAVFPRNDALQPATPGARIVAFSPDFVAPYIQQTNIEIERQILSNFSVSSGWMYTKGTRLRSNEDINLFPPGQRTVEIRDTARNLNGFFSLPWFGGPSSRPNAFFDQIAEFRSDNNSVYHAFFVEANKRYSHGLQFLANYTLSKLIDRGPAPGNQIQCCTSENTFDPGAERGLGRRDQRHRFNLAAVWDIAGGWQANTIVKIGSGRPLSATVTGDSSGDLNGNGVRGGDRAPFFGPWSFTGPGYATVDLAVRKVISIEGKRIDFGIEAFNLFNRANYLRPATEYYRLTNVQGGISRLEGPLPTFGQPVDAMRSRELQAVLRFFF
jgi:hypothetical protein